MPVKLPTPVKRSFSTLAAERIGGEGGADRRRCLRPTFSFTTVADIVDEIDVVAGAAVHRVGAGAAVELVVAAIAVEDVVAAEAEDLVGARRAVERVVAGRAV